MKILAFVLAAAVASFAQVSVWDRPIQDSSDDSVKDVSVSRQVAELDSVPIYDNLIEKYDRRHEKLSRLGNIFLASGSVLLGGGLCLMVSSRDADELFLTGVYMALVSPYPITAGIILKAVGGKQGRNSQRFREQKDSYVARRNYQLSLSPTFRPESHATGAVLSLSF